MADDEVTRNLQGMEELDFKGWNRADWQGVFAHLHTDDVVVEVNGQPPTRGLQEHIAAMKALVESTGARRSRSPPTRSGSAPESGPVWSGSSKAAAGW